MNRIENEANANDWSDDILEECSRNPLSFMAFRSYVHLETYGKLAKNPVPYIHKIWFIPVIFVYISVKFLLGFFTKSSGKLQGNVFCCTSTAGYRSESFFELLEYSKNIGEQATLYSTKTCKSKFLNTTAETHNEFRIITFSDTFKNVSPIDLIRGFPKLLRINKIMAEILEIDRIRWKVITQNALLAEYVKYMALGKSNDDIISYHTYAPMPYQIMGVDNSRVFTHQHGIQAAPGDRAMAIPKYAPVNYFIYGEYWRNNFERKAHPESNIYAVGNVRFDELIKKRSDRSKEIDLLFVSGSHILNRKDFDEVNYKELVDFVVELCEANEWELAIKLHPIETRRYYDKWGYSKYITDCEDITELLLISDIAVTDVSTAFMESILLGTPMVVTQHSNMDLNLESISDVDGLTFPQTLATAKDDILRLKGTNVTRKSLNDSHIIEVGKCKERILKTVTQLE